MQNEVVGAFRNKKDRRNYKLIGILQPIILPKQTFYLTELFHSKNQKSRPSCTSQAQCHHKERQEQVECSARFIMALTKEIECNKKEGACTKNTFKIINKYGVPSESMYQEPEDNISWEEYIDTSKIPANCYDEAIKHKSSSYWELENNIDFLRQTLVQYKNSIVISMAWYKEFNGNSIGNKAILPTTFIEYAGGHAVEIVGFDDFNQLIKIKNSWGIDWGDKGFFYMPYEIFDKVVWDMFCSLDIKEKLPVDNYYGFKRNWLDYLLEKKIAFDPFLYKKIGRLPNNREITALRFYWDYESVFKAKYGDLWLYNSFLEAKKKGLIKII